MPFCGVAACQMQDYCRPIYLKYSLPWDYVSKDLCMTRSDRMTGIYDSCVLRPPPFLSTPIRPANIRKLD